MNKQKYLAELSGLLSFLSEEDRETVMSYYTRKFDEAGEAGQAELIQQLGTPMRLAISLNRMGIEAIAGEEETKAEPTEKVRPEYDEKLETAELIRAVMDEPEAEPGADEEPEGPEKSECASLDEEETEPELEKVKDPEESEEPEEESTVTEEIEYTELSEEPGVGEEEPTEQEPEDTAEAEPEAEAETENEDEDLHRESFPELTVARGGKAPEPTGEQKAKLSIVGAIAFWILMILPGLPLLVLSVALVPVVLAPGAAAAWAGAVGLQAGMAALGYIPDAMFVFGGALLLLGAAILLLLLAVWIIKSIVLAWKNGVPALWGRLARKEKRA